MVIIKWKFILTCPICLATTLRSVFYILKVPHGNNFDQYMTDDINKSLRIFECKFAAIYTFQFLLRESGLEPY